MQKHICTSLESKSKSSHYLIHINQGFSLVFHVFSWLKVLIFYACSGNKILIFYACSGNKIIRKYFCIIHRESPCIIFSNPKIVSDPLFNWDLETSTGNEGLSIFKLNTLDSGLVYVLCWVYLRLSWGCGKNIKDCTFKILLASNQQFLPEIFLRGQGPRSKG